MLVIRIPVPGMVNRMDMLSRKWVQIVIRVEVLIADVLLLWHSIHKTYKEARS